MTMQVKVAGTGVITALGQGKNNNVQGMRSGKGLYRSQILKGFDEPVVVPYLSVEHDVSACSQGDAALAHLQWLLDCAIDEALDGIVLSDDARKNMPLFIGSSSYGINVGELRYQQSLASDAAAAPIPLDGFTQVGNHLRHKYGFLGADYAYNTACTSGANALLGAMATIAEGRSDYALVIGLETFNTTTLAGFYGMQLLAPEAMRPFDKRREGLVLGEGCGVLLLCAARPGDTGITFCGGASRCDTHSIAASNPDGSAIALVMRDALEQSGVGAHEIVAIKAHGTGSPLNDDGEAAGMTQVFATVPPFFSLKSYIGHTLGGCGVIEAALMSACLAEGNIPASAGFECFDDSLGLAPITHTQAAGAGYYMLNFFGFGGNNCSLIISVE